MLPRGVVYVAIRDKYLREATQSARSLRRGNPRLPITLFTNKPQDVDRDLFRDVRPIEPPPKGKEMFLKQIALQRAPYDRILYLDADTYICANIGEMFGILDSYEVAAALAPRRVDPSGFAAYGENIPEWFPEVNGGVILCRRSPGWDRLLRRWGQVYAMLDKWNDQMALRVALYHEIREHRLQFYCLAPEYNCRTIMLQFIGARVRILHGRDGDMDRVCSQINSRIGARIWMPKNGLFRWRDWQHV